MYFHGLIVHFLLLNNIQLCACITVCLSTDLSCLFPSSSIMNKVVMNTFIQLLYEPKFSANLSEYQGVAVLDREGNGNRLQYSCLGNPTDEGAWWAAVHGVAKSRTRLSDFTFTFHFHALEKAMVTHSSVLAWRIPGTGEPGELPSMGSHRVGHD